jgi:hypothetical protein
VRVCLNINSSLGRKGPLKGINLALMTDDTLPVPVLVLHPLGDSFDGGARVFELFERVSLGRSTGPKSQPGVSNGWFSNQTLSRLHAELYAHNGKVNENLPRDP